MSRAHHRQPTRRSQRAVAWTLVAAASLGAAASLTVDLHRIARAAEPDPASLPLSQRPLADPVVHQPVQLKANRASTWKVGDVKFLLLEGDATIAAGVYGFRADRVVVRIDTEKQPGKIIRHLAMYLDNAKSLHNGGSTEAEAPRLLVTVSTSGGVDLTTDLLRDQDMSSDPLAVAAAGRTQKYFDALAARTVDIDTRPLYGAEADELKTAMRTQIAADREKRIPLLAATRAAMSEEERIAAGGGSKGAIPAPGLGGAAARTATPAAPSDESRIIPPRGQLILGRDKMVIEPDEENKGETDILLLGNVRVIYNDPQSGRTVSLKAENAVIFATGLETSGLSAGNKVDAAKVRGIYLEDNVVASDGNYTVRAPRVYYDLANNKAILLDAVFYTYDVKRQVPIYLRADKLREEARSTFSAQKAIITTSEFAEPHFSIGVNQVTVTQERQPQGPPVTRFTARDLTMRAGDVPFFYLPAAAGDASGPVPLRDIGAAYSSKFGPTVKTTWDTFGLLGRNAPDGVESRFKADYLGEHGPAGGLDLKYDLPSFFGQLDDYLVLHDTGEDKIGGRNDVPHDGDMRGYLEWRHRQYIAGGWELSLELSYVSDETFLEEFFRREAENSKPYETSAYIKRQQDDWQFSLLAETNLNNFTPQTTVLQSPGYTVQKLPELAYDRVGTALWDNRLTYYTESRVSRMQVQAGNDTPGSRGFKNAQAMLLFGISASTQFEDAVNQEGIPRDEIYRFDTRHELDAPLKLSIFDITPYVAGRVTAYSDDFNQFNGNTDEVRFWGQAGTRLHTSFTNTYGDVNVPALDVHRLRHIIEPHADLSYAATNVHETDLPYYDFSVERINEGYTLGVGATNTLQTERGGAGRWRSVDWIVLDTDFTFRNQDGINGQNTVPPLARFVPWRPEFSTGGDSFHSQLFWQISDTLGATGEINQNLDSGHTEQWRVGLTARHTPNLVTFIDYDEIDSLNSRLLSYGFTYVLTPKYTVGLRQTIDLATGAGRSIDATLERKLPSWRLLLMGSFDAIENDVSVGVVLIPQGVHGGHRNLLPLTPTIPDSPTEAFLSPSHGRRIPTAN